MPTLPCFRLGLLALACALAGACASGPSTPVTTTVALPQTGAQGDVRINDGAPEDTPIAAPVARVWALLPAAYQALEIPISNLQPASYVIGATNASFTRTLGGERLSRAVSCGTRGFGTNIADEGGGVVLTITTTARAAGDSTYLRSVVTGTARMAGASGGTARCTSTGRIETRLVELVRQRLAAAP